jgi:hypothetical protein
MAAIDGRRLRILDGPSCCGDSRRPGSARWSRPASGGR